MCIAEWWLDTMRHLAEEARASGMPMLLPHLVTVPGAMYILSPEEFYFVADLIGAE